MKTSDSLSNFSMKTDTIKRCRIKIQEKLGLASPPEISISVRCYEGPDRGGRYRLPAHKVQVDEPAESLRDSGEFGKVIQTFKYFYGYLPYSTRKDIPYRVYLMEPLIRLGKAVIAGGVNWIITGILNSGEKYAAVMDVEARPMLRGCSLMTLMTQAEMELAEEIGCDFIHTWHTKDNPHFLKAVLPELNAGFTFYRGDAEDGEEYEDKGFVHLRYYLDRHKKKNVLVSFVDGNKFKSPKDNAEVITHLLMLSRNRPDKLVGKGILSIEASKK